MQTRSVFNVIDHVSLNNDGALVIEPAASLQSSDFDRVATISAPCTEDNGQLNGLTIRAQSLAGWLDFKSMAARIKCIRDRHGLTGKAAVVADEGVAARPPVLANRLAGVKHLNVTSSTTQ